MTAASLHSVVHTRLRLPFRTPLLMLATSLLTVLGAPPREMRAQDIWKINAVTIPIAIPHVAVERVLGERRSIQVDLMVSPWKSVNHAPMQFGMLIGEWQWHARDVRRGPYVGAHLGVVGFRFQRWDFRDSDRFQEGIGAVLGTSVGWRWSATPRLHLDAFVGGGTIQSKYKGYYISSGERYDGEPGWNESGEWLLYRAGVFVRVAPF